MSDLPTGVLCCIERERLELEWLEVRTRGQHLRRLRNLSRSEWAEWDRRERAALARLTGPRSGAWVQQLNDW
jgi:hypothetical protein